MPKPSMFLLSAGVLGATLHCQCALGGDAAPGAQPGDEALTCEQIATGLAPYVQQMKPNVQALALSQQQQLDRAREMQEKRSRENEAIAPLATLGALDPTGASKRAYQQAAIAQAAKERREDEAEVNSPLAKQAQAQREQVATQGLQMKDDARLQRLMVLAQSKGCTRK